jgi:hypothetical protein
MYEWIDETERREIYEYECRQCEFINQCTKNINDSVKFNITHPDTLIIIKIEQFDYIKIKVPTIYEIFCNTSKNADFIVFKQNIIYDECKYTCPHNIIAINDDLIKDYKNFDFDMIQTEHHTNNFCEYILNLYNDTYNHIILYDLLNDETFFDKYVKNGNNCVPKYKITVLK